MNLKVKNNGVFQEVVIRGLKGEDGVSVPKGGTTGQVLQKNTNTDFDFSWTTVKSISVKVSVPTSSWISDSTYAGYAYKASVTISGVTSGSNIIVGISESATLSEEEACASAGVQAKGQATNTVYLYSKTKPTVALPISVIILG